MSLKPFNIGRDCRVVLVYNGSRIDLPTVTGFNAAQRTHQLESNPLNDMPLFYDVPGGWGGQFSFQRDGSGADDLFAAIESGFWSAGTVILGSIYQYVTECDGSLSTYEFIGASLRLSDAGRYQSETLVTQTITFTARARNRIS
ncbi:hypothetical protein ACM0P6_02120 [Komagataeibacter sucrofermentans]|uniref:Phage tail protein n=1 Tax=Komagataeibacter sucrofermentans TaxID=1053551 RepID=A0A318QFL7_9PROT|nr:hypothetical protein [Komagataeibacter sucrofermentans]PYD77835.1 hypothetical protein CFR77_13725 [Komagataeibacter sucrofermentans]GBQ46064.1 hypothetical protein AA15973_0794 [Komagataeibacter sucrofermentans DSM 15973]